MGIDRTSDGTDANNENVEDNQTVDRRSPPPDRPGSDAYPSRADSRAGAAAANDVSSQATETQPESERGTAEHSPETSGEERTKVAEGTNEVANATDSNESLGKDGEASSDGYGSTGGRPDNSAPLETAPSSSRIDDHRDPVEREGAFGAPTTPHDGTGTTNETSERPVVSDVAHSEESTPGETSGLDIGEGANADTRPMEASTDRLDSTPATADDASTLTPGSDDGHRDVSAAPHDVADDARNSARPSDHAAALVPEAAENGDHSESTIEPQQGPSDLGAPPRRDNQESSRDSDSREQKSRTSNTADEDVSTAARHLPDNQRTDDSAGEADDEGDTTAQGGKTSETRPLGELLMVGDKTLREYLDPAGAAAWSNEVGDQVPDPTDRTGHWIADTENKDLEKDKKERGEAFRKRFKREREGITDTAGKTTSKVQDLIGKRPPAGHQEVRTGPDATPAPHLGVDAGDVMTAGFAAGVMLAEGARKLHGKIKQMRKVRQ